MSEKHKVENATAVDPAIIKLTRDTLGQFVKRPPLTEKLLNKPPFRFLHDIMTAVKLKEDKSKCKNFTAKCRFYVNKRISGNITSAINFLNHIKVISTTGFMKGLFLDAELDSENVKDKDAKIAFLQKAIHMVLEKSLNCPLFKNSFILLVLCSEATVTGHSVLAKPNKIVAGQDPEKTNEFLQALAEAISKKVDNDVYVTKVLAAEAERKKLSSKTNKPMTPRRASIVKESKTEAGAVRQEDNTVKSETKSEKPRPQSHKKEVKGSKSEVKTEKKEVRSDRPAAKTDKPESIRTDKSEGRSGRPVAKTDKPETIRRDRSEGSSDRPVAKTDKPESIRTDKSAGRSGRSVAKTDQPETIRRDRSEGSSDRPLAKTDKPETIRRDRSEGRSDRLLAKPGKPETIKRDKSEGRSDTSVAKTDKPETIKTDKSAGRSDKLESRREKRVIKTDKQDTRTDKQVTRTDKEVTRSDKEVNSGQLRQNTKSAKREKRESRVVKHDVIPEQVEADDRKTNGQKSHLTSLDVTDTESSKLVGDSKNDVKGHANSKTGAVCGTKGSEPGKELPTVDKSKNQDSKLNSDQEPTKVLPITQTVDSNRQKANQVAGEKQQAKTELPASVQKANSFFSKKEAVRKDLLATGGKASNSASEKQEAKKISAATGYKTKNYPSEHPKSTLAQDDGSTDSSQTEALNVRQEKSATENQQLLKALRNDELKNDASNAFTTNKSSSTLTSKFDLLTCHHQEIRDERDVRNDLPVAARHESLERNLDVKLQDVRHAGPNIGIQRPNESGHLLLNPPEKPDLRLHEHQSAQEFWDSRHERKTRKDKAKGEKRMDMKSEKRKISVSKQEVRPDKLASRPDQQEMHTIKESRTDNASLKFQKSPPNSEGEKTDEPQTVSQKMTTAFHTENQRFEDEHQKPEINHEPDVDVILDGKDQKGDEDEDDEAEFLVREDPASAYLPRSSLDLSDESNEHGGLVQKILKTKKGLEALVLSQKSTVEIDRSEISGGDISKKRQRALVLKDVSKLRATIQALTGNVIPLVKIMDFLQEDLDCMKKEMEQWKDEVQANTLALQHEQRLLESAIEPLQIQLYALEKQIEEQEEMNAALKSQALQNEERIRKMITTAAQLSK